LNSDWRTRYESAIEAARQAGKLALGYFDRPLDVEWKSNQSPVTIADREAEQLLRSHLRQHFPGDGFLGEESGETAGTSGFRWIVDPIDGTRSFVRGIPLWATLVGLEYRGEQIAGICFVPALEQTFHALRGNGAYRDERRIHVSEIATLAQAQIFYSGLNWFIAGGWRDGFLDLCTQTERQRGFGDFYGFVLVAQGSGEMMLEYGVHPWDVAALKPLVEEAGGMCTDWDGAPTIYRPDILASNGKLHQLTLKLLQANRDAGFRPDVVEHAKTIT
jgi:histidinol-phosphatase